MEDSIKNLIQQILGLSLQRQVVLVATTVGSLAFFFWISTGMGAQEFRPLYRGLNPEEAARIADALSAEKIEYRLEDGATTVSVPVGQVPEARIRVAGKGLPGGASNGFELFDRPAFGVTDFVHRVNFARAVQGELTRSIEQLDSVARARVQVVIPERTSVLSANKREPSAAVVVRLVPGHELDRSQTKAIVHLVASSIESLEPSAVTVVDGNGRLLAPLGDEVKEGSLPPGGAPAHQARVEAEFATRIEAMLEPVVGMGGVVARVSADMNWTESEVTEERFDPDSQIARSESRTDESESAGGAEGGAPGVAANVPGESGAGTEEQAIGSSRVSETFNYEISKTVSHKVTAMGTVERLSVAVLVDSDRGPSAGAAEGDTSDESAGWSPEALEQFEQLAREAVGYNKDRGDRIVVSAAPFRAPNVEILDEGFSLDPSLLGLISQSLRIAAQLIALLLFARFVVKPLIGVVAEAEPAHRAQGMPAMVSELEAGLPGGSPQMAAATSMPLTLADKVSSEANDRTEDSVNTIRNWLQQA